MLLTMEQLNAAFKPENVRAKKYFDETQAQLGHKFAEDIGCRLSHYEDPGRNERLECVVHHISRHPFLLSELVHLRALHDHKGELRILLNSGANVPLWKNAVGEIWGSIGLEDPECMQVYHFQHKEEMYCGTRYKIGK